MDAIVIGALLLVAGFIGGRVVVGRAFLALPPERKAALVDAFIKRRIWRSLPMLGLLAAYWGLARYVPIHPKILLAAFMAAMLAVFAIQMALDQRMLARVEAPAAYVRATRLAFTLQVAGILGFFAALWLVSSPSSG